MVPVEGGLKSKDPSCCPGHAFGAWSMEVSVGSYLDFFDRIKIAATAEAATALAKNFFTAMELSSVL